MTAAERLRALPGAGARVLGGSLLLPGLILLATVLRVALWKSGHPLHHDEALYGSWARLVASGRDPLLLTSWVDKPPLALYMQAAALRAFGPTEMALRLPGMIASILAVPLLYGIARYAYGRATALMAAALLATCGFAIQFSPTTFTDPWLALFMLAACWTALAGRSFLAGLAVGLALASKQQGLLVAPLAIALLAVSHAEREGRFRLISFVAYALLPALFGFAVIFVPVTYWDSLRWAKRPSFWDRSLATYGGLHLAGIGLWPHRIAGWSEPLRYLFGPPAVTAVVAAFAALGAAASFRRGERDGKTIDRILAIYVVGFLAIHVGITFQPWDRYLLPLAPLVALLGARGWTLILAPRPVGAVRPSPRPCHAGLPLGCRPRGTGLAVRARVNRPYGCGRRRDG
jgi:4-amino-4-deoxy-L-arabinose transferase-like glycosyltransferase